MKRSVVLALSVAAGAALTAVAGLLIPESKTFRSPTVMTGLYQDTGLADEPVIEITQLNGRDLVNLALGAPLGTPRSNEVLALEVSCEVAAAQLVVYDKTTDSNLVTIATTSALDVVAQQDQLTTPFPNRARFVGHFTIEAAGNEENGLTGGYLTLAGRVHLDPQTGCPEPRLVDRDRLDKIFGDKDPKRSDDEDDLVRRTGLGHYIGVLRININSQSRTVLIPHGTISIRRQLQP
jgi:hypothetical protein